MAERYIAHNLLATRASVSERKAILWAASVALKQLKADAKRQSGFAGGTTYVGLSGLSLVYLNLAAMQQQHGGSVSLKEAPTYLRKHTVQHCLQLSTEFLEVAESVLPQKRVTFLEGYSGVLAQGAALAGLRGDDQALQAGVQELQQYAETAVDALPPGECELLYGRAGYIYSLLWLEGVLGRQQQQQLVDRRLLQRLVGEVLEVGVQGAASDPALAPWGLMYSWHGSLYLGAAHGLCGILYVLLCCLEQVQQAVPDGAGYRVVTQALEALMAAQFPSGNLPSSIGRDDDRLVQWCHGAAGFIPTMVKAHEVLGGGAADSGGYLAAARRAADTLWERGLLRKGLGLCHGISGNAYAFLALYRATGEELQLARAEQFGLFAAQHWQELHHAPDRFSSLYEGLAGAVALWLDLVLQPERAKWPGAEL